MRTFPTLSIPAALVKNNIDGLLILNHTYADTMSIKMVRDGFKVCGQHVTPSEKGKSTVSFDKKMWQCYSDIAPDQLQLMKDKTELLATRLRLEGRITCEELLAEDIRSEPTSINRDNLTYIRHWSEIVNHEQTVDRYRAEMQNRDPLIIAQRRQKKLTNVPWSGLLSRKLRLRSS